MYRAVLLALVALLPACGEGPEGADPLGTEASALSMPESSTARSQAMAGLPSAHVGGAAFAEARVRPAPDEVQCIYCGRETGFSARPELEVDVDGKTVTLSWGRVDGADFYTVHAVQWSGETAVNSFTWRTSDSQVSVELDAGHRYSFHMYAWADDPKRRSSASDTVDIDL